MARSFRSSVTLPGTYPWGVELRDSVSGVFWPTCERDSGEPTLRVLRRDFDRTERGLRAVATRYDKREYVYQGTVDVASIRIWVRDP